MSLGDAEWTWIETGSRPWVFVCVSGLFLKVFTVLEDLAETILQF